MATTINAYSVSLGLDSSNYIDSSKLSRAETAALKRDINSARDPMENLQRHQDRLTKALNEGAISVDVYNRLMQHYTDKMHAASGATDKQASSLDTFSKVGNVITGVRQGLMLVGEAVGFVTDKFDAFNNVANDLDDANDAAKKLGLSFNELGSLQFAAERLGGGDAAGAIDKALGHMLKNGIAEPGESAVDTFKRVADQVQNAATQTERAQIAAKAFGKSGIEILAVLQSGSAEIENLVSKWEKTNALSDEQLAALSDYNDQWDDVVMSVEGFRNIFTSEIAQSFSVIGKDLLGMTRGFDDITKMARQFSDDMVAVYGTLKDVYELGAALHSFSRGNVFALTDMDAMEFNSAEKLLQELYDKRFELTKRAAEEERRRIEMRNKLESDGIEEVIQKQEDSYKDLIDGNAEMWDKFIDKRNDSIKLTTQALSAAERELNKKQTKPQQRLIEVGSADDLKFLAELASANDTKPTEEEILAEAVKQREIMEQQRITDEAMKQKLQELIEVSKENGFKRIR